MDRRNHPAPPRQLLLQQAADLTRHVRIQPGGRFIQNHHVGAGRKQAGKRGAALLSLAQNPNRQINQRGKAKRVQNIRRVLLDAKAGPVGQVLPHGEVGFQAVCMAQKRQACRTDQAPGLWLPQACQQAQQ